MKRKVAVVTVARSDFGIYLPILEEIRKQPDIELQIIAAAAHLSPRFGHTVDLITSAGFQVSATVPMTEDSDDPVSINRASAKGVMGFSEAYERLRPELILLLGDRYEMHAAGVAAIPHLIPVAHIHGGEETMGAIDNLYRHSLTKLSHIHFASTQSHANRIIQMGEDSSRVFVVGAPGLDKILGSPAPPLSDLLGAVPGLSQPYVLATLHPVTTKPHQAAEQTKDFLNALKNSGLTTLLTMPNADTGGLAIRNAIYEESQSFDKLFVVENLGPHLYHAAMAHAEIMAGNSSSGIIEAASFGLPVVNIGDRQLGRTQSDNVVNCGTCQIEIEEALKIALSPQFKERSKVAKNVYGNGLAARKIVEIIKVLDISPDMIRKSFVSQAIITG